MGVFLFSMKMLKKEYKKSLVYGATFMFTIAVCFIFFNITNNPLLRTEGAFTGGSTLQNFQVPLSSGLSFFLIVLCSAMIIFAFHFLMTERTKEIAIMSMAGQSYISLTKYLFYQNCVIIAIIAPFGLGLGYLFSVLTQKILYDLMLISASIYTVSIDTFYQTIITSIVIIFTLLVYSSGYVYRHDIQYLLSTQTTNELEDKRLLPFPNIFYVFVYIFGIILMIFSTYSVNVFIFPCLIGVLGANGMLSHCLPSLSSKIKRKFLLTHKLLLISVSHFSYSLKKSIFLVSIYTISIVSIIALIIANQNKIQEFVTIIIAFIVSLIMLSLGILYKYLIEVMDRKIAFYNLYKLGYTRKQIKKMIFNEVFLYYFVITMIPLIYVVLMVVRCYLHQDLSLLLGIILISIEVIVPCIIGIMTYIQYKKIILKGLQEGVHYE